jgi:uncharacterized membrane protein YtjA (UPF0391 family)
MQHSKATRDFVPRKSSNFGVASSGTIGSAQDYSASRCVTLRRRHRKRATANRGHAMLSWVVTFLVVALIAGILGFGGIAGVSIEIAKAIFFIAVILFLVSAVVGLVRGRSNV